MASVPQFISKLYKLAHAPTAQSYITWSEDGLQFWVTNIENFSRDVLPVYFKHNNYASFVRQLNMYGFHRSTEPKGKVEPGVTLIERFSHPMFLQNREELIAHIHRKTATATKRIKTEEPDLPMGMNPPPAFAQALAHSEEQAPPRSVSELREAVARLEGQNASLVAQSLQQQEILNHIIRVLARHNLLSEVELPRNPLSQPHYHRPAERAYGHAASGEAAAPGPASASVVAVAAAATTGALLGAVSAPQMKWDSASPPVQVDVDEENFSAMLDTLDLPFSLDPPILC